MKTQYQAKRNQGFTIIEVLIVLAIAALILLIVFLAVPALQRNARNTQRKSDAANIGAAIANFASNSNGALPNALANSNVSGYDTKAVYFKCDGIAIANLTQFANYTASPTGCDNTNKQTDSAKLGYYTNDATHILLTSQAGGNYVPTPVSTACNTTTNINTDCVVIDLKYPCNSSATDTGPNQSSKAVDVLWVQETNGGNGNLQCVEP